MAKHPFSLKATIVVLLVGLSDAHRFIVGMKDSASHIQAGIHACQQPIEQLMEFRRDSRRRSLRGATMDDVAADIVEFHRVLDGFSAELELEEIQLLQNNEGVEFVEPDGEVHASVLQHDATWGLDRIDQDGMDGKYDTGNLDGHGVDIWIIDTGILAEHQHFSGRIGESRDFIGDGNGWTDCNGHGTHCAGTAAGNLHGVARGATLHAVRVLDCGGSGSYSGVLAGLDWVVEQAALNTTRPAVASMSLGGGYSAAMNAAVDAAEAAGVTVVVAAGNDNGNACLASPASADGAITVGATDSSDRRSYFSNYGECVDIFAPGSSITSAWHTSPTAENTIDGTSMACPHVAGVAAIHLARLHASPDGDAPSPSSSTSTSDSTSDSTFTFTSTTHGAMSSNALSTTASRRSPHSSVSILPATTTSTSTSTSTLATAPVVPHLLWPMWARRQLAEGASEGVITDTRPGSPNLLLRTPHSSSATNPAPWQPSTFPTSAPTVAPTPLPLGTVIRIVTQSWGSEVFWRIDGGQRYGPYADFSDNVQPVVLGAGEHTIELEDTYGDGWHGGWWSVLQDGVLIAGGEDVGQVAGAGGSAQFVVPGEDNEQDDDDDGSYGPSPTDAPSDGDDDNRGDDDSGDDDTPAPTSTPTAYPTTSSPTTYPSETSTSVPTSFPSTTAAPSVITTSPPSSLPTVFPTVEPSLEPTEDEDYEYYYPMPEEPESTPQPTPEPAPEPTSVPTSTPVPTPEEPPPEEGDEEKVEVLIRLHTRSDRLNEAQWSVDGGQVYGPFGPTVEHVEFTLALAPGAHHLRLIDTYGDGWHEGAYFEVLQWVRPPATAATLAIGSAHTHPHPHPHQHQHPHSHSRLPDGRGLSLLAPTPHDLFPHIIGGIEVSPPNKYSFLVALSSTQWAGDSRQGQFCGGSLIRPDRVATAAHCCAGLSPDAVQVLVGWHDLSDDGPAGGLRVDVSAVVMHPQYNAMTLDADVCYLTLADSVPSIVATPIALHTDADADADTDADTDADGTRAPLQDGEPLIVAGWGNTEHPGYNMPSTAQEVGVPYVSNDVCNGPDSYAGTITDGMMCAGLSTGGVDACQGDSGGPLFAPSSGSGSGSGSGIDNSNSDSDAHHLVGIVSWGVGCALPNMYGVYARVSTYADFLAGDSDDHNGDGDGGGDDDESGGGVPVPGEPTPPAPTPDTATPTPSPTVAPTPLPSGTVIRIVTQSWGSEVFWRIDGGQRYGPYADFSDNVQPVTLGAGEHTIELEDAYGDGWHGGWWSVLQDGVLIAGGEDVGQVAGAGGSAQFVVPAIPETDSATPTATPTTAPTDATPMPVMPSPSPSPAPAPSEGDDDDHTHEGNGLLVRLAGGQEEGHVGAGGDLIEFVVISQQLLGDQQ